jgi:hypothetical protein
VHNLSYFAGKSGVEIEESVCNPFQTLWLSTSRNRTTAFLVVPRRNITFNIFLNIYFYTAKWDYCGP